MRREFDSSMVASESITGTPAPPSSGALAWVSRTLEPSRFAYIDMTWKVVRLTMPSGWTNSGPRVLTFGAMLAILTTSARRRHELRKLAENSASAMV